MQNTQILHKVKWMLSVLVFHLFALTASAQGWPEKYDGVMLQGFYWNSFKDSKWTTLEKQADELARYFSLVWIPQSGNCDGKSMGYNPKYYWDQNSSFGTEKELRSLISALKDRGTGTIADVVINHRQNKSNWVDFVAETYNGVTYEMRSTDICSDDDGGKTAAEAKKLGLSLSANKDSGEGWDGMRDLDHASENVQKIIKAYENYLLNDLGYAGFRYDVGKGFAAKYFAMYNKAAKPRFSVGEVWDSNDVIKNWINGTKVDGVIQSAAFDFQYRYQMRDAINNTNWLKVGGSNNLIHGNNKDYRRYSITFVENHDTEDRIDGNHQDPIKKDTLAANACLLAMPGTPCVFMTHWMAYKKELKQMIEARKLVGIHSESDYVTKNGGTKYIAIEVTGTRGKLIVVAGPEANGYTMPDGYKELLRGYHYRYLVSNDTDTSSWESTLSRIEKESQEQGGDNPDQPFVPHDATVYVKADFTPVYFYIWDSNNNTQLNGNWPGKQPKTVEIDGETWYTQTVNIATQGYYFNIIFNQGNGKPQTDDIEEVTTDRWFTATISNGRVLYEDVTETMGIEAPSCSLQGESAVRYNVLGQRLTTGSGLYIVNGKKYVK